MTDITHGHSHPYVVQDSRDRQQLMNETVEYDWNEEMAHGAMGAWREAKLGRSWFLCVCIIAIVGLGVCVMFSIDTAPGVLILALAAFGGYWWFLAFLKGRQIVREMSALLESPRIHIKLTPDRLRLESSNGHKEILWEKLSRCIDNGGFLLLYARSLLWASIPKAPLTNEQADFIKSLGKSPGGQSG